MAAAEDKLDLLLAELKAIRESQMKMITTFDGLNSWIVTADPPNSPPPIAMATSATTSTNVKRIVAAFESARIRRQMERRRQRLDELFAITTVAASPAPSASSGSPPSSTPTPTFTFSSATSTPRSTTTPSAPTPSTPTTAPSTATSSTSTTTRPLQALPTGCSTPALPCMGKEIFATMPTKCSTQSGTHIKGMPISSPTTTSTQFKAICSLEMHNYKGSTLECLSGRYITTITLFPLSGVVLLGASTEVYASKKVLEVMCARKFRLLEPLHGNLVDKVPWPPPKQFCSILLCGNISLCFSLWLADNGDLVTAQQRAPQPPVGPCGYQQDVHKHVSIFTDISNLVLLQSCFIQCCWPQLGITWLSFAVVCWFGDRQTHSLVSHDWEIVEQLLWQWHSKGSKLFKFCESVCQAVALRWSSALQLCLKIMCCTSYFSRHSGDKCTWFSYDPGGTFHYTAGSQCCLWRSWISISLAYLPIGYIPGYCNVRRLHVLSQFLLSLQWPNLMDSDVGVNSSLQIQVHGDSVHAHILYDFVQCRFTLEWESCLVVVRCAMEERAQLDIQLAHIQRIVLVWIIWCNVQAIGWLQRFRMISMLVLSQCVFARMMSSEQRMDASKSLLLCSMSTGQEMCSLASPDDQWAQATLEKYSVQSKCGGILMILGGGSLLCTTWQPFIGELKHLVGYFTWHQYPRFRFKCPCIVLNCSTCINRNMHIIALSSVLQGAQIFFPGGQLECKVIGELIVDKSFGQQKVLQYLELSPGIWSAIITRQPLILWDPGGNQGLVRNTNAVGDINLHTHNVKVVQISGCFYPLLDCYDVIHMQSAYYNVFSRWATSFFWNEHLILSTVIAWANIYQETTPLCIIWPLHKQSHLSSPTSPLEQLNDLYSTLSLVGCGKKHFVLVGIHMGLGPSTSPTKVWLAWSAAGQMRYHNCSMLVFHVSRINGDNCHTLPFAPGLRPQQNHVFRHAWDDPLMALASAHLNHHISDDPGQLKLQFYGLVIADP